MWASATKCSGGAFLVCTAACIFGDGSPNKSLYTCSQGGVWAQVGDDGVPAAGSGTNAVLSSDGTSLAWRAMGGDISGPPQAAQVQGLQGRVVAPDAPGSGQVLTWNIAGNRWEPVTPAAAASGVANYGVAFSGQSSLTIPGATHGLNSANLISDCYLGSTPLLAVSGYQFSIAPVTYDATITFPTAFTGTCVLNASGGAGGGSSYARRRRRSRRAAASRWAPGRRSLATPLGAGRRREAGGPGNGRRFAAGGLQRDDGKIVKAYAHGW